MKKDKKPEKTLLASIEFVDFSKKGSTKIKPNPYAGMELLAEFLFCRVFGDQKYNKKADCFRDEQYFKAQIKKLVAKFKQDIENLQASEIFIQRAQLDLKHLEAHLLNRGKFTKDQQIVAIHSLAPIATFLGYGDGTPHKSTEPYFIPSIWEEMFGWNNFKKYYDRKLFLENDMRLKIIEDLVGQGYTKAEIALIMNQSGYKIAQYLNKIKAKKGNK